MSFALDEALLFTGGEDAVIHAWRMMDLVDFSLRSEEIMPVQSWNEHTLSITAIICGNGTAMTARVYSASLDQTVKVQFKMILTNSDLGCVYSVANDDHPFSKCNKHTRS